MRWMAVVAIVGPLALFGCGGDSEGGGDSVQDELADLETGDRGRFNDEADGVRAVVADCFIREASDGSRRYSTTIEIDNGSDAARLVTVTVESDLGWGGVSDMFEVPAGGRDAWPVTSDEATNDEVGDVECADYISGIVVTVESPT